jgi:multidrug efflux system membrane fusion protein
MKSAIASAEIARQSLARQKHLVERGIAAQKEVEAAQRDATAADAAVAAATSGLAAARDLARRSSVHAPFDGVVASRSHNPGDLVEPGIEPILRFVDPSRLQVEASVPVTDLPRLRAGAEAKVSGPAPLAAETGSVVAVPGAVDPVTATAVVRIALPGTTALPSGTPVRVDIVAGAKTDALIVPVTALVREGDDAFVYVLGEGDIVHRRKVTAGLVSDQAAEILTGIEEGERVVSEGAAGLPDGAKVAIRE